MKLEFFFLALRQSKDLPIITAHLMKICKEYNNMKLIIFAIYFAQGKHAAILEEN